MVAQLDSGIYANMTMGEKLPYACGGIVVAGLLYLVFALIVKLVGVRKVMRLLPPVVTGPIIISIGLSLASSAVNNAQTNWIIRDRRICGYCDSSISGARACSRSFRSSWVS